MLRAIELKRGLVVAVCALAMLGLGGATATHAQTSTGSKPPGPDPNTLPQCTTISIESNAPPPGPPGAPGIHVCNGGSLVRTVKAPRTPTPSARGSGIGPLTPPYLVESAPLVYTSSVDTDAEGIYAWRTVSTVTPPPNGGSSDETGVYTTMHIGDTSGNWTEIGWSYFDYAYACGSGYWLYAYQGSTGKYACGPSSLSTGSTIYVMLEWCGGSSSPYTWCDYYWNGSGWVQLAYNDTMTTNHAVNSRDPNIDYEVWTDFNSDGLYTTVSSFTTDPVWLYSASGSAWQYWTVSSTVVSPDQQSGKYCITMYSNYDDWTGQNC